MKIEWDFEKGLLAFMAVLILAGVGVIIWQRGVADELNAALPRAENRLAQIGRTAGEILALRVAIRDDDVAQGMQAFAYLESQMVKSKIGKKFDIGPGSEDEQDGYTDTVYTLRPSQANMDFNREELAVFLLHVEAKTTLMKITRIKLDISNRRGATSDDWKPLFEITERRADILTDVEA